MLLQHYPTAENRKHQKIKSQKNEQEWAVLGVEAGSKKTGLVEEE